MSFEGIFIGFLSALSQALSYVFSALAVRRFKAVNPVEQLCRVHIIMGLMSVVGLCFVWTPSVITGFSRYFPALTGVVGSYMVGQVCLFINQRKVDSSRIVPLLGLKLVVLAIINMFILPLMLDVDAESYTLLQWLGMALTILSAFLLNNAGGRIPLGSLAWIVFICIGYAGSDTFIKHLLGIMRELGSSGSDPVLSDVTRMSLCCVFLAYILGGVMGALIFPVFRLRRAVPVSGRIWLFSIPFAVCWLISMICIYLCFDLIGTVGGNVIQSTRGLLAIVLGWLLAKAGLHELERPISNRTFACRLLAGLLMVLAILCFNWH